PIPDYDILTEDACKFILEQSKAYFEETVTESEQLTQRSSQMLFLLIPGIAAVLGFCVSNQEKLNHVNNFGFVLILADVGALAICIMNLFKLIGAKNMHYRGSKPKEVMRNEIFTLRDIKQVEKDLYVSEIERYQYEIEQMEYWNYERILIYLETVKAFYAFVVIGIVLFILSIYRS
ncbi:MAG: hypothetical protein M3342_23855, partial [Bacteroidota bacterium]|nr:hypothetical protein [Bacteroidota bacterium]